MTTHVKIIQWIENNYAYFKEEGMFYRRLKSGLKPIGSKNYDHKSGKPYLRMKILGKHYAVHRLVWLVEYGNWPSMEIDHIDGDTLNNCVSNLRDVCRQENTKNMPLYSNNTSGHVGVTWDKQHTKWLAYIYVDRRQIKLGRFKSLRAAVNVRLKAERQHGFSPTHGKR